MDLHKYIKTKKNKNEVLNEAFYESTIKFIENILEIRLGKFQENECNIIYYDKKEILIPRLLNVQLDADTTVNTFQNNGGQHNSLAFLKKIGIYNISNSLNGILRHIDFLMDFENEKIYFIIVFDTNEKLSVERSIEKKNTFIVCDNDSNKVTVCHIENLDIITEELYLSV